MLSSANCQSGGRSAFVRRTDAPIDGNELTVRIGRTVVKLASMLPGTPTKDSQWLIANAPADLDDAEFATGGALTWINERVCTAFLVADPTLHG